MAHGYQVRLYDRSTGAMIALFDDWNSLYYFKRLNDYGYHTFSIDGEDPRVDLFQLDTIIQVLRRDTDADINWYEEYVGFHRTGTHQVTDRGRHIFSCYGRGLEDLLKRRHILWRPGDIAAGRGAEGEYQNVAADDAMTRYVFENIGAHATTGNGRMATGYLTVFDTVALVSAAPVWAGRRAYKNLLSVIQEISQVRSVDFDVTWSVVGGVVRFAFHTFYPRKGTDRTGAGAATPVIFSLEHANMSAPYLTDSRMEQLTAVYVLGQGEGTARIFVERTNSTEITASPYNRIEYAHDARNEQVTAALQAIGDGHLIEHGREIRMSFQVVPSPGSVYGKHYFLGDLVIGKFHGAQAARKVMGVEITVAQGREDIRIHFEV